MDLEQALLAEHSRAQADKIVQWIGNDQRRFDQLFKLFQQGEYRVVQHAAWPLSYAVQKNPGLLKKHYTAFIRKLGQPGLHDAVRRNSVRILQDIDIPPKFHGAVMNACFAFLLDPLEKPAVKAFSLTVLQKLAMIYPDIGNELKVIIDDQWPTAPASFRSRANKVLKALNGK
jgi:hypothetical protein